MACFTHLLWFASFFVLTCPLRGLLLPLLLHFCLFRSVGSFVHFYFFRAVDCF